MPNNVGNIVPAGTKYTWNVVTNPNLSGYANQTTGLDRISQLLNNLKNTNQILNYNVTATTLESCASTFSITVGVKPVSVIANKTAAICTGAAFNATPVNGTDIVPAGTTYTFDQFKYYCTSSHLFGKFCFKQWMRGRKLYGAYYRKSASCNFNKCK